MNENWYQKYLPIPFKEKGRGWDGVDCWGLPFLAYPKERNIILPDYLDVYQSTNDRDILGQTIQNERNSKWKAPEVPATFDIIILKMRGVPMHCGIVIKPGLMIHCAKDINTVIERYDSLRWKNKVVGFARYE
jgi:cell wall-associated NlpC family hydrolase